VLTGSQDNTAKLWDAQSGQAEKTFTGHTASVSAVAFSPDGKKVLTGSRDWSAKWWDVQRDAIEDKIAPYSFYELVKAGFQLEEEDMGQFLLDSITFFEKTRKDSIQYHFLMDSLAKVKGLIWDKKRMEFREKSDEAKEEISAEEEDSITILQNQIATESDTIKLYALYGQLIDSLKNRMRVDPKTYVATLADAYNNHAWYGFFGQAFKSAEQDIRAGIAVDSTYKYLYTNLAPALLLQGQYKAAEAEYLKWKDQPFGEQDMATYRAAFLADLEAFEKAGIIPAVRKKDVEKIRGLLKE
jgi:WD domain, G-beta repeat